MLINKRTNNVCISVCTCTSIIIAKKLVIIVAIACQYKELIIEHMYAKCVTLLNSILSYSLPLHVI